MKKLMRATSAIAFYLLASDSVAGMEKSAVDEITATFFKPAHTGKLEQYGEQQFSMQKALDAYVNGKFKIKNKKLFLADSFGLGIKRQLNNFIVKILHGEKVDEQIVEGLSSVTIWKIENEYFSLVVSEMIPGGDAIYGYYKMELGQ